MAACAILLAVIATSSGRVTSAVPNEGQVLPHAVTCLYLAECGTTSQMAEMSDSLHGNFIIMFKEGQHCADMFLFNSLLLVVHLTSANLTECIDVDRNFCVGIVRDIKDELTDVALGFASASWRALL